MASPEDLVRLKAANAVHPDRPAKRATDHADVGSLAEALPGLDRAYLLANATRLGADVVRFLRER